MFVATLILALCLPALAAEPLTLERVEGLIEAGLSDEALAEQIERRGVAFVVTATIRDRLGTEGLPLVGRALDVIEATQRTSLQLVDVVVTNERTLPGVAATSALMATLAGSSQAPSPPTEPFPLLEIKVRNPEQAEVAYVKQAEVTVNAVYPLASNVCPDKIPLDATYRVTLPPEATTPYRVAVAIDQEVRPGATDRFALEVGTGLKMIEGDVRFVYEVEVRISYDQDSSLPPSDRIAFLTGPDDRLQAGTPCRPSIVAFALNHEVAARVGRSGARLSPGVAAFVEAFRVDPVDALVESLTTHPGSATEAVEQLALLHEASGGESSRAGDALVAIAKDQTKPFAVRKLANSRVQEGGISPGP